MAPPRRMTRQVQMALSHSEKAKRLSYSGFYDEALKELNLALRAFEVENREGIWDDAVAGVLNNAGYVYLFLGNYPGSEDTFRSALALKERLGDRRSLAGTLAGLSDAYRGQGKFDDSASMLEHALEIALSLKDRGLAGTFIASMDSLERARCDMPDAAYKKADFDELYAPASGLDVLAKAAHLGIALSPQGELHVEADIGFPYLMKDLAGIDRSRYRPYPAMAFLFPKGIESCLVRSLVTDEEEMPVGSSASSFDGILYGPGSYHRCGPMPMPACKSYFYTYGAGHILEWDVGANGWYHVEVSIKVSMASSLRFSIALPFGSVKLGSASLSIPEPGAWTTVKLASGTFNRARALDTIAPAFSPVRVLYEGPATGELRRDAGVPSGVLCLDLIK